MRRDQLHRGFFISLPNVEKPARRNRQFEDETIAILGQDQDGGKRFGVVIGVVNIVKRKLRDRRSR
jgi:hypothetical protein